MEKIYLGISLGFNSSVCLYSSTRGILAALSQEKINKQKNTKEIPVEAMLAICKQAGVTDVDQIGYSHYQVFTKKELVKYASDTYKPYAETYGISEFFTSILKDAGIKVNDLYIKRVTHHIAHSYSAFPTYGLRDKYFVITSDGFGDGYSGMIKAHGFNKNEDRLSTVPLSSSVALIYQFTTGALGFKEHQHEGKVTGLAAYGVPRYLVDFTNLFNHKPLSKGNLLEFDFDDCDPLTPEEQKVAGSSTILYFGDFMLMKKKVYKMVGDLLKSGAKQEDIAASVQLFAKRMTMNWIENVITNYMNKHRLTDKYPVYLAGGLFANALINQCINESNLFSEVLVAPAVGDEGNALGVAAYLAKQNHGTVIGTSVSSITSGPELSVTKEDVDYIPENVDTFIPVDIYKYIAIVLADKRTVCLVHGPQEFGSRALCNRSILYEATKKETNNWLNKKLGRTEFMPYAPVVLEEDANDLFEGVEAAKDSAKFMALTFKAKQEFLDNYKAVYHVDGTARPQLVNEEDNPYIYRTLREYRELTGNKALINTSFNMHNQPIVSSFKEVLDSWLHSDTDILVFNDVVFMKKVSL